MFIVLGLEQKIIFCAWAGKQMMRIESKIRQKLGASATCQPKFCSKIWAIYHLEIGPPFFFAQRLIQK